MYQGLSRNQVISDMFDLVFDLILGRAIGSCWRISGILNRRGDAINPLFLWIILFELVGISFDRGIYCVASCLSSN